MGWVAVLLLCAYAIGPVATDPPAASEPSRAAIELLILRAPEAPATAELGAALRVRLPDRVVDDGTGARASTIGRSFAFVDVRALEAGGHSVTIILPDGRAYDRDIAPAQEAFPAREVASIVAHMVATIERGDLAPDRTDAKIPTKAAEPEPEPTPPTPTRERADASALEPTPQLWVGPWVRPDVVFGVGPPRAAGGFVGAGASLGASLVHRRGGFGLLGVRGTWIRGNGATVHRVRIAVGGGYRIDRAGVDVRIAAAATVEPWVVTEPGSRPQLGSVDGGAANAPLIGGLLSVAPGFRWVVGDRLALRVSGRFEVAGSAAARADGGVLVLRRPGADPLFRLGGIELGAGLVLGFERGVMRRRASGTSKR